MSVLGNIIDAGASLLGGVLTGNQNEANAKRNIALQKDFATHGIRWKVEDAKAAGIHPLAALGAQTMSFSPVSVGDQGIGSGLAAAGQDIGRAVAAGSTQTERVSAYDEAARRLNLEHLGLQNQLLASQIARVRQPGTGAPIPSPGERYLIDGQTDGPFIMDQALKRVSAAPEAASQEPGAITDVGYARTPTGWAPVPASDVKQRIEDNFIPELMWSMRNLLMPTLGMLNPPAGVPLDNEFWIYDPIHQEYRKKSRRLSPAY